MSGRAKPTHVLRPKTSREVMLQRFFLTELYVEQVQALNPDAVFSTDSLFTLMTDDEFAAFLGESFARSCSGGLSEDDFLAGKRLSLWTRSSQQTSCSLQATRTGLRRDASRE